MSSDPTQELQVGQIFEGKYKILRELGRGGFGMVYLAFQEGMDRHVALKVLRSSVTASAPSAKDRFLREVKIISKLKHPNTVTIHDFGETYEGGLYMVLEYVEGETLKQVVKREGAQDMLRGADLARQIARSLAEAHRHGVVHRDLKPANIMITSLDSDRDFVKVLDFGVARLLDSQTDDLTSVGLPEGERELIGTPRYMSPEQVRGESLTGASDIYGLGLMLYEMLSGSPAVQGDTTMGLITQQISPEPLNLPHTHAFDPVIQDIIRISTAKQVSDRFQTSEQMADALEQAIFQIRRDRNLTGPQTGDGVPMSGYHSQLQQLQPGWNPGGGSGFHPQQQQSGWNANANSGHWQSGPQDSFLQTGPGFDPNHAQQPDRSQQYDYGEPISNSHWDGSGSGSGSGPSQGPHGSPFATAGGMLGVAGPSGFNEIELPTDDDFNPTVERDALNPAKLAAVKQGLIDRNQHPNLSGPALPGSDLPPLPKDEKPFAPAPEPMFVDERPPPKKTKKQKEQLRPADVSLPSKSQMARRGPPPPDESLSEFTIQVVKGCVFAVLALVSTYFSFLIVGAVVAQHAQGTARLLAAAAVALAVPMIALVGEMSSRDRFRAAEGMASRIGRILMNTAVFAIAVIIVSSASCAGDVVYELQEEPNWFLAEPEARGFPSLNKRVSYAISGFVAEVGGGLGLYDPRKARAKAAPRAPALPAPTRKGNAQPKPTRPQNDAKELRDSKKPTSDYEKW